MDKSYYAFPAIFHYANDGISIEFPDLPGCLPCASSDDDAFKNAKEALGLHLFGMEQDGDTIPLPSQVTSLKFGEGEIVAMIDVFMPAFRDRMNNQFVKKTLSVPAWLNSMAEQEHINFSRVLQDGLKQYLGL